MIYWPNKTADMIVDVGLDWGPALSALGDKTIVNSIWTKIEGGMTSTSPSIDADGRGTNMRLSAGGIIGEVSIFRNDVTLDSGEVLQAYARSKVKGP